MEIYGKRYLFRGTEKDRKPYHLSNGDKSLCGIETWSKEIPYKEPQTEDICNKCWQKAMSMSAEEAREEMKKIWQM